jgi:hypothetical protein
MQIFPHFVDIEKENPGICQEYLELSLNNIESDPRLRNEFSLYWSELVSNYLAQKFPEISMEQISNLYSDEQIKSRAMRTWKYAAKLGVHDPPQLFFRGKKLINIPETASEWQKLLNSFIIL